MTNSWPGDYVICPEDRYFRPYDPITFVQHEAHEPLPLERVYVTAGMTYEEALAVAWVLHFDRAGLMGKSPPVGMLQGPRPLCWLDTRDENGIRSSSDTAVAYEVAPDPKRLISGFALIQGEAQRARPGTAKEIEEWLASLMSRYGLSSCWLVEFSRDAKAFWTGRIDCIRVAELAKARRIR